MLTGWVIQKCCEKYQLPTLSRRKLHTMGSVGQNTKLELKSHEKE